MAMISACSIVKNEAGNMNPWLSCVREFADEIIVVDTGSDDNTVALAEASGAKVFHFKWIGDFSAAKNFALDQAKGDWIVFLDADEYFPPQEVKKLRPLIEKHHPRFDVVGLMMRMDNVDRESKQNLGTSFYQIRVFRRLPWLRYEGRIHEQLKNYRQARKVKMLFEPDIVIYHTGYSQGLAQQKAERNLKMIIENQEKFGKKPLDDFHLADCYYSLQDWQQAAEFARRAIQNKIKAVGQENRPYAVLIQSLMFLKAPYREIEQVIEDALTEYPEAAEFWMLWGMVDWDREDWQTAREHMEKGLDLYAQAKAEQGERLLANLCLNLLPLMYLRLGKLTEQEGDREKALQYYWEGLDLRRYDMPLLQAVLHMLREEETADVIAVLNQFYDKDKDAGFLVQVLKKSCHRKACLYYDRRAKILTSREKYLLAGRVREAAADLISETERYARLGIVMQQQLSQKQQAMLGAIMPVGVKEKLQVQDRDAWEYQEILGRVAEFLRESQGGGRRCHDKNRTANRRNEAKNLSGVGLSLI